MVLLQAPRPQKRLGFLTLSGLAAVGLELLQLAWLEKQLDCLPSRDLTGMGLVLLRLRPAPLAVQQVGTELSWVLSLGDDAAKTHQPDSLRDRTCRS